MTIITSGYLIKVRPNSFCHLNKSHISNLVSKFPEAKLIGKKDISPPDSFNNVFKAIILQQPLYTHPEYTIRFPSDEASDSVQVRQFLNVIFDYHLELTSLYLIHNHDTYHIMRPYMSPALENIENNILISSSKAINEYNSGFNCCFSQSIISPP